ncbi:Vacuolar protein sorting-associated protein 70 [Mucor circinelloides]
MQMDQVSQRLELDQRASKRSYASIEPILTHDDYSHETVPEKRYARHVTWVSDLLGSDRLAVFHEKQRAFRARQKPGTVHFFLASIVFMLLVVFGARSYLAPSSFSSSVASEADIFGELFPTYADLIKDIPSSQSIRDMLHHYASQAHLAGTHNDHELAKWTRDQFTKFGLKNATIETYYPFMNYPTERKLGIVTGNSDLLFLADLEESKDSTPTFHAYSADGNVTGSVVYVNYGRLEDFVLLAKNNIELKGTIALMRDGGVPSSIKIQHAETFGCVGALVYTDPADNKDLGPTGVRRDSVQYGFIHPGDPSTPGFAATLNATRNETFTNVPRIPSLPISWADALPLLRATQGLGFADPAWVGGIKEIDYFSGPSLAQCNLVNYNEFKKKPIWNVMARIPGHEEDEKAVIIGNHRDAWDQGASDPSSGSAVMLELARVFGILLEKGWKPRRTIILASWDASEFGNIGSTEYVEDHLAWLNKNAVAYLDVDHAVTGPHFNAQASPMLNRLLVDVASMVIDPLTSKSVYESWVYRQKKEKDQYDEHNSLISPVGKAPGLDTVAFFEHAGISSLSMSFDGDNTLLHSALDDISWMEQVGDPTYEYHQTMVRLWGLLALRLSSDIILPLYPMDYALTMKQYLDELTCDEETTTTKKNKHHSDDNNNKTSENDLPALSSALDSLYKTSIKFNSKVQDLSDFMDVTKKHGNSHKKWLKKVKSANDRLIKFERVFVENQGLLVDRPWYKHAIYGPSAKSGLLQAFPSIIESRELKDLKKVGETEKTLAYILKNAQSMLSKGKSKKHVLRLYDDNQDEEIVF